MIAGGQQGMTRLALLAQRIEFFYVYGMILLVALRLANRNHTARPHEERLHHRPPRCPCLKQLRGKEQAHEIQGAAALLAPLAGEERKIGIEQRPGCGHWRRRQLGQLIKMASLLQGRHPLHDIDIHPCHRQLIEPPITQPSDEWGHPCHPIAAGQVPERQHGNNGVANRLIWGRRGGLTRQDDEQRGDVAFQPGEGGGHFLRSQVAPPTERIQHWLQGRKAVAQLGCLVDNGAGISPRFGEEGHGQGFLPMDRRLKPGQQLRHPGDPAFIIIDNLG